MCEATSPARAPPMPSATTNRGERSRKESSLLWRARPTSESAAFSAIRRATRLLLVAVLGVADPDHVGHLQLFRLSQLTAVEERPVGGSHVLYVHELAAREDPGVRGGGERVVDPHVGARRPPHRDSPVEVELLSGFVPQRGDHLEAREHARAQVHHLLRRRRGRAGVVDRHRAAPPGHVAERRARDPQQEEKQHGEEAELQQDGDGVVHSTSKTSRSSPSVISSPGDSAASGTRWPLTFTPLVEPRSATTQAPPSRRSSAWRRLTFGSSSVTSQSRLRPITTRLPLSTVRLPPPTSMARPPWGCGASIRRASRSTE